MQNLFSMIFFFLKKNRNCSDKKDLNKQVYIYI